MRLDPISVIRLLRGSETRPRQAAENILLAQVNREVERIFGDRPEISEPEVCDLCGRSPGPGHGPCNRAIAAGLD